MWVTRLLKRPVDKDNAPSLSRAESKKLDSGFNRSFVTQAHHLHLVATSRRNDPTLKFPLLRLVRIVHLRCKLQANCVPFALRR